MKIEFNQIGNSTGVITVNEELKFALDPALASKGSDLGFGITRLTDPIYAKNTFDNIDFWLLTHAHLDHLDQSGADKIENNTPIFSTSKGNKALQKLKACSNVTVMNWNQTTSFETRGYQILIKAIPAYHGFGKLVVKLMEEVNGYVISISKNNETKTLLFASDTVINNKYLKEIESLPKIDLLIANLGEAKAPLPVTRKPITMGVEGIKTLTKIIKPSVTIPVHIDDYSHFRTKRSEIDALFPTLKNGESQTFEI